MTEVTTRPTPAPPPTSNWTAGRIVAVIVGSVLVLMGFGALLGAAGVAIVDQSRDSAGFVSTPMRHSTTEGYALRYDALQTDGMWAGEAADWIGTVRIRVVGASDVPVFVGVARTADVQRYCGGPEMMSPERWWGRGPHHQRWTGAQPPTPPAQQQFWAASATGTGEQELTWEPQAGNWTVVVLNADATAGVQADVEAGATLPGLQPVWIGMLVGGVVVLVGGAMIITVAARGARRRLTAGT